MSGSLTITIGATTVLALSPAAGLPSGAVPFGSAPSGAVPLASASPPSASAPGPAFLWTAPDPNCPRDISGSGGGYKPPTDMAGLLEEARHEPEVTVRNGHAVAGGARSGGKWSSGPGNGSGGCIGVGSGSEA
ncbi:MAG TPA: hypothetical protein VIQ30_18580, partial [Pseudonocardia sp.]